jgi:ribonuclease Z
MMRYGTGFDVEHVFLTHMHGDHTLGLPGLSQTLSFNDREKPLSVHAPAGTRSQVEALLSVAGDRLSYPVRVGQVEPGEVVLDASDYEVQAFEVDHDTRAVGYALVEHERRGRFDRETAEKEFGIPPGPKYSKLHAGESVEHEGRTIQPETVVGPPRPGRRFVYTGDTRPADETIAAAENADLLVHDGSFGDEHRDRARKTGHSTAREAAAVAREASAKALALVQISSRYAGQADRLAAEAREVFADAFVACDGMQVEVPFPDSDQSPTIERPQR